MIELIFQIFYRTAIVVMFCIHTYFYYKIDRIPNNYDLMLMIFLIGGLRDNKVKKD